MTKYTRFEAIFRNETLVFTDRDPKFRNRLDVYNYICAERLGKKYGIARVLRVLAATIKQSPMEYDSDVVAMANWVPPIRAGRNAEAWFCSAIHRAYVQGIFREYANLRKL